jgi:hypothetical protein
MSAEKTHYRKAFKSPYLSSADIVEPTDLTISHVRLEIDKTKKTKDMMNTAYFKESEIRKGEPLKPMILNVINSKMLAKIADSAFIDDWQGLRVTVFVDKSVRFGNNTVEGLRLTALQRSTLSPANEKMWAGALAAFKRDGNADAILKRCNISPENLERLKNESGVVNVQVS